MHIDLNGKIALVTGASRGIGQAIMMSLGRAGAFVIGTATHEESCARIERTLSEHHLQGAGHLLNLTHQDSLEDTLHDIAARCGAPLILVNNAGACHDNLLLRMKPEQWSHIIKINLDAVYFTSRWALRAMRKARWGRMINITSVVGQTGNPGQTNYCAAKAGIQGFTKALAQEVARSGITANAVAPGFMATDMTRRLSQAQQTAILARIPMGVMGQAEHIAHMVTFLAGDQAAYITGQILHINGGMCMV